MLVIQQSCIQYQHSLIKIVVLQKVKLGENLKFRLLVLNFAFLSFVDRFDVFFFFLILSKKKHKFFYNNLSVQGVIAHFYDSSKQIGIFLDA